MNESVKFNFFLLVIDLMTYKPSGLLALLCKSKNLCFLYLSSSVDFPFICKLNFLSLDATLVSHICIHIGDRISSCLLDIFHISIERQPHIPIEIWNCCRNSIVVGNCFLIINGEFSKNHSSDTCTFWKIIFWPF